MKNILTAIGNEELNNELKKLNNFNIINSDIQYRDGILEVLEYKKEIDILILSNQIPGEIEIKDLINKIYLINNKIKIYFITNELDKDMIKFLKNKKVEIIFFENKINLQEIINNIYDEKKINYLNKNNIINNKENEINKNKNLKKEIKEKNNKKNKKQNKNNKKIKNKINNLIYKKIINNKNKKRNKRKKLYIKIIIKE